MSGNITEEQFVKFCEDFVEKYEGRNFQELVRSLGSDISVAYHGKVNTSLTFTEANFGMYFGKYNELSQAVFGYFIFLHCYDFMVIMLKCSFDILLCRPLRLKVTYV